MRRPILTALVLAGPLVGFLAMMLPPSSAAADDGGCQNCQANGTPCNAAKECVSNLCVDGYCCGSACTNQCGACNVKGKEGTCTAVSGAPTGGRPACATDGSPCGGTCDGRNLDACAYPGGATRCRQGSCSDDGNGPVATLPGGCNGKGACGPPQTASCAPYRCSQGACLFSCSGDQDCVNGVSCIRHQCLVLEPRGERCGFGEQCATGHCVDGYCCDGECEEQCGACNLEGHEGTCTAVTGLPVGERPACGGTAPCEGRCGGSMRERCEFPGASMICGQPHCEEDKAVAAATCDGNGACAAGATMTCPAGCNGTVCAAPPDLAVDLTVRDLAVEPSDFATPIGFAGGGLTCAVSRPVPGRGSLPTGFALALALIALSLVRPRHRCASRV